MSVYPGAHKVSLIPPRIVYLIKQDDHRQRLKDSGYDYKNCELEYYQAKIFEMQALHAEIKKSAYIIMKRQGLNTKSGTIRARIFGILLRDMYEDVSYDDRWEDSYRYKQYFLNRKEYFEFKLKPGVSKKDVLELVIPEELIEKWEEERKKNVAEVTKWMNAELPELLNSFVEEDI